MHIWGYDFPSKSNVRRDHVSTFGTRNAFCVSTTFGRGLLVSRNDILLPPGLALASNPLECRPIRCISRARAWASLESGIGYTRQSRFVSLFKETTIMLGTVQVASYVLNATFTVNVTDHPIVLEPFAPRPDVKLTAQCVHTVRGLRLHRALATTFSR